MIYSLIEISEPDFLVLSKLLTSRYGIKLPLDKRVMFQSRLQSRLRELKMDSFTQYSKFTLDPENKDAELETMINYISTNKTEFFREQQHFDFLQEKVLPEIIKGELVKNRMHLNCWSAGCSKGQEAFTLAMIIDSFREDQILKLDYSILGTDVSDKVLEVARNGIYSFDESKQIPAYFLKRYVLKSKDQEHPKIKIQNSLRAKIQFQKGNLMSEDYQIKQEFQIIFIRNTLIYFDTKIQTTILQKVLQYLVPGGYLFIGHSESLINRDLPIQIVAPSIYKKN